MGRLWTPFRLRLQVSGGLRAHSLNVALRPTQRSSVGALALCVVDCWALTPPLRRALGVVARCPRVVPAVRSFALDDFRCTFAWKSGSTITG